VILNAEATPFDGIAHAVFRGAIARYSRALSGWQPSFPLDAGALQAKCAPVRGDREKFPVNSRSIVPPARIGFDRLARWAIHGAQSRPSGLRDRRRTMSTAMRSTAPAMRPEPRRRGRSGPRPSVAEAVITMLPDGDAVRTCPARRGRAADCLLAGLSRGSVLVDMSSSSPLGTRELGARLAERGVAMLDAPVSAA